MQICIAPLVASESETCYIPRWFTRPQAVTHPSTNRAQCRLTTLIEANALTTTLCRHPDVIHVLSSVVVVLSLVERRKQWLRDAEEQRARDADAEVPAGHRLMSDDERLETLDRIQLSTLHSHA